MKIRFVTAIFFFHFLFLSIFSSGDQANARNRNALPGFIESPYFDEQVSTFNYNDGIRIQINAPLILKSPIGIVFYPLPNGNTIEQTVGKITHPEDDWHFDIQHIGAQTRFLRSLSKENNIAVVYLETGGKSWPSWKRNHPDHAEIVRSIVDSVMNIFNLYDPFAILSGHSGGGRFVFSYLDSHEYIPEHVRRISFMDSNYGYTREYGLKIVNWLKGNSSNNLCVLAYNDSAALYKGERFVSDTGGTWYRSKLMLKDFSNYFEFEKKEESGLIRYSSESGRIQFLLKKNPDGEIFHTKQIEFNGFIHSLLTGTELEESDYEYFGDRIYDQYIQSDVLPRFISIPAREHDSPGGSEFMLKIDTLEFDMRENAIFNEISSGNLPGFLLNLVAISDTLSDVNRDPHSVIFYAMPDYLSVGSDEDFCRIPLGPVTAQKLADRFGAILPTSKLVDIIYQNSEIKPEPFPYKPVGNQNELVSKFIDHNGEIEKQIIELNGTHGQLISGIKKDIIISSKLTDPKRPNHVTIYGWHKRDGIPIQPVTNVHVDWYVDYSHGARLVNDEFLLDGRVASISEILKDPVLFKIFSYEENPLLKSSYIK